ncbi:autophagy protein 16, partial [Testicularia cyperi]
MAQIASNWHHAVYLRLQERDALEKQHDTIHHHYRALAEQTRLLKQRNRSLLNASALGAAAVTSATTTPSTGSSSGSSATAGTGVGMSSAVSPPASNAGSAVPGNPVHLTYIASLEQQLSTLRDEVATLYKTQGQNAQRLLLMNESLREKEHESRTLAETLSRLQAEHEKIRRQADDLGNVVGEKERSIQILQDELATLSLELSQIEGRNEALKKDNASLLQRWLDRMNQEADRMNEGTLWLEEVRRRKEQPSASTGSTA